MRRHYLRTLIYEKLCDEWLWDPLSDEEAPMGRHYDEDGDGVADQAASTAGEQDHSDPWAYAGEPADAPVNPEDDDHGVA